MWRSRRSWRMNSIGRRRPSSATARSPRDCKASSGDGPTMPVAWRSGAAARCRPRPDTGGCASATGDGAPTPEARSDVEKQMTEWRRAAPGVVLLDPVYMPESRSGSAEEQDLLRRRLQAALRPRLAEVETLRHAVESQLRERTAA